MTYTRISFLVGIVCLSTWAMAQPLQPERLEIELDKLEDPFEIQSLGEDGLVLYREVGDVNIAVDVPYEFIRYDTAFEKVWEREINVHRKYNLIGWDLHRDSLYFLFDEFTTSSDYLLIKMGVQSGDTTRHMIRKVVPIQLTEFESVGNALIFAGYVNGRSTVLLHNRYDGKSRVLPNFYEETSELMELSVNDYEDTFDVSVVKKEPRVPYRLTLRTFNDEGLLLREQSLSLPNNLNMLYGRSANQADGHKIVAGTYSDRRSEYSKGVFIGSVLDNGDVIFQTHTYEDLNNFFNYMRANRRERVQERVARRRVNGRRAKFAYRLLVHDIIEQDGYFIMVGEAFYPVYRYYGGGGIGSGGAGSSNSTFFDGYRYTHSVVIGFNHEGEVLWNNSFEIEGIQSLYLQEFVKVHVNDERIVLLYLYEGEIRSKVVRGSTMEEGKFFDPIELKFSAEIVQSNDDNVNYLERWYGDNFYAAGVQEIRRLNQNSLDERRRVFYINKIIYP